MAAKQERLYGGSKAVSKCYEPFPDTDTANAALQAFNEELYDLRIKHGLADVLVTVADSVVNEDDDIGTIMLHSHFGRPQMGELMAAYTFGRVQEERQGMVMRAASTKAIHPAKKGE